MKTTYKFILAALAATVTLASCTKDPVPGKSDSDSAVTYRTITVSFDSPTKAKLDGTKPKFQRGDMILLSDGEALDTCEVAVKGGVASIDTKLKEGKSLTAVYPMSAVRYTEPQNIASDLLIPTRQSGKFSDANICVAKSSDGKTDNLKFENVCPILRFYVDSTIAVKSISIKCEGDKIASDTAKTANDQIITLDAKENGAEYLHEISEERVCYVAVMSGVSASTLTFISDTDTQDKVEKKSTSSEGLRGGVIYNAFIPYSIRVGDQKWGYCNVGAFYPEDQGEYFAWGEIDGYRWDAKVGQFEDNHKFWWENCPSNNGKDKFDESYFIGEMATFCPGGTLALKYDAANANWGDNWRMPTINEMRTLINDNKQEVKGEYATTCLTFMQSPLKFYANLVGDGNNSGAFLPGQVLIWTSSLNDDNKEYALCLSAIAGTGATTTSGQLRCDGLPIRPIYDGTMSGDDAVGLLINSYNDGKTL